MGMILPAGGGGLFPNPFSGGGLSVSIHKSMFFDRSAVKNALTRMELRALSRGSLLIRRIAQKSIGRVGMAKPQLREMRANPGVPLAQILKSSPSLSKTRRQKIIERIREIKTREPSSPGSPPNTHVPFGHMLGFRRNIYNAYDAISHSGLAGPSRKGERWTIPQLHEYGGTQRLQAWMWRPRYDRYTKPIIRWATVGQRFGSDWLRLPGQKDARYPPRPYMRPALEKAKPRLAEMFRDQFRTG
jgi:hypothetical protein